MIERGHPGTAPDGLGNVPPLTFLPRAAAVPEASYARSAWRGSSRLGACIQRVVRTYGRRLFPNVREIPRTYGNWVKSHVCTGRGRSSIPLASGSRSLLGFVRLSSLLSTLESRCDQS